MGQRYLMWLSSKNLNIFILSLITIVAFLIRFVNLNQYPPGFTWDEAALGYNAYSILQTGKDEYGTTLPLIFKSFGDYKPGIYVYLTVPFVAVLGLTETAVRLPSVIFGSFIPLLAFLVINRLLQKEQKKIGYLTAMFLAISPWAVHFSRGAWEANIAFFQILLAMYLFLLAKAKGLKYLFLSALIFAIATFTYQSARMFAVLLFISLLIFYHKKLFQKSQKVLSISLLVIFLLLAFIPLIDPLNRSRLSHLNQYSYQRSDVELSILKAEDNHPANFEFEFFHSHNLEYLRTVIGRYLGYFSPKFLFIEGAPDARTGILDYGVMHLFEIPFFIAGIYFYFKKLPNLNPLLAFGVLAPIPAALTRDITNTVRSLPLSFFIEFIAAVGLFYCLQLLKPKKYLILFIGYGILILFNLGYYFDLMFVHSKINASSAWLGGYQEAIEFVKDNSSNYEKIIFTTAYNEPYIFYLFYSKYDPVKYQPQAYLVQPNPLDVGEVPQIDNIEFRKIYWPSDRSLKNTLFIGSDMELPEQDIDPNQSRLIKRINLLDGQNAFKIIETL